MMIAKVTYEWTMIYSLLPDRELSNVTAQSTLHLLSTLLKLVDWKDVLICGHHIGSIAVIVSYSLLFNDRGVYGR